MELGLEEYLIRDYVVLQAKANMAKNSKYIDEFKSTCIKSV